MRHGGRTAGRRWASVGAFTAILAVLIVPGIGVAQESAPAESSPPPAPLNPDDFSSLPPGTQMPEQPSQNAVTDSATAYTDLSDDAALDLAREQFSEILHADLVPELELDIGQPGGEDLEVDKYLGLYAARVIEAGHDEPYLPGDGPNPNTLVQSTMPLRAPEGGDLRPLDSDLEQVGDHFEASNPVVDTEISADLDDGVEIPAADVTVAPEAAQETTAVPVADKVFFPNAAEDSDYLIAPAATGAEVFIQLRSSDSPESFVLDVAMPEGAVLASTPDGGAAVIDAGQTVVSVEPPSALDAAGQQVDVHYAIDGTRLTVEVDHSDADALYPIMVDPFIDYYPFDGANADVNNTWGTSVPYPGDFSSFYTDQHNGALINRAVGGRPTSMWETTEWYANPIRSTSIERVDYLNLDHTSSSPTLCTFLGIWQPGTATWTNSNVVWGPNGVTSNSSVHAICGDVQWSTWAFVVGFNDGYDGPGGDPEAQVGSQGRWILVNFGNGYRSYDADSRLRSANVYRVDTNAPSAPSVVLPSPSSAWTDQPYWFYATDPGLGVSGVWVWNQNMQIAGSGAHGCNGMHGYQCPSAGYVTVNNLPEGRHNYTAVAVDPVLNGSAGTGFTARIDRTQPHVEDLSGSLVANKDAIDPNQSYTLSVSATDGNAANADLMQSGVTKIQILDQKDGVTREIWSQPQSCDPDIGSCRMPPDPNRVAQIPATIPAGTFTQPGQHTIRVVATDALGHVSDGAHAREMTINVLADETDPQISIWTEPRASDGTTVLHYDASDPGPASTGVDDIELWSDGVRIGFIDNPCKGAGCTLERDNDTRSGS